MNRINLTERRKFPRIEKEVALKIRAENCDLVTQTKNISCVGAYCWINRYIPPLTKLSIILLLPHRSESKNGIIKVQCRGVVVRTEKRSPQGFDIAIYFNEINNRNKGKIEKYINQFLT